MEELGPHQTAMGPYQADASLHQAESGGSQHSNPFVNLQHRGDHEGSAHTTHTSRSQSRGKGHVSYARNDRDMQREIDKLKEELRHHDEDIHRPILSCPQTRQMMLLINEDLELRPMRLFPTTRSIAVSAGIRAHPAQA